MKIDTEDQPIFFKIEKHNPLRSVLVVMKDYEKLKETCAWLRLENYHIITARNGKDALKRYRQEPTSFVISDWDLPQLSGVRLFQQIRNIKTDCSPYLILAAEKTQTKDLSAGFFAGADEYILKPMLRQVLHARMHAGMRILKLQHDLIERNQELNETNAYLSEAYQCLDEDLKAAGKLQSAQRPAPYISLNNCEIAIADRPLSHIGGDVIGYFSLDEDTVGIYAIDVMGHSVSAALLGFMLGQSLNPYNKKSNPAFKLNEDGSFSIRAPHELLTLLNKHHQSEDNSGYYFTMAYAQVNCKTGEVSVSLAGQPEATIIRSNREIVYVGETATPIGILEDGEYETNSYRLNDGDKLMLFSDGLIDAFELETGESPQNHFTKFIQHAIPENLDNFSDKLFSTLQDKTKRKKFYDDISAIIIKPKIVS